MKRFVPAPAAGDEAYLARDGSIPPGHILWVWMNGHKVGMGKPKPLH
jgi:hypothetical protein